MKKQNYSERGAALYEYLVLLLVVALFASASLSAVAEDTQLKMDELNLALDGGSRGSGGSVVTSCVNPRECGLNSTPPGR